jgi:outer membrane protein OmpA-like peptidoglycan-associated protein/Tol biopolymer transport system component
MKKIFYLLLFLLIRMTYLVNGQENNTSKADMKTKDSAYYVITNLGENINTPYDEYAPIISADGSVMMFTSRRPILKEDIDLKMQGMENVYISEYNDMTWKWSKPQMLAETVNQKGKNNSAIALSNDGQRLLLYRGDPDGNIYESILEGETWSEPVKLPKPINSKKHESSASIAPDGRTIYFVSNRKGGEGGSDIWVCRQGINGWEKAENLGKAINTSENEEGVFIHPDGKTLYFSSKGHNSRGGYDIFKSVLENGKWTTAVSMGDSVNTPGDELFYCVTADGKTAYYSSARPGSVGKKDIYEVYFKSKKSESSLTLLKGIVIDADSFDPVGADIEISDNEKNEVIAVVKSNSSSGKYLVSLPAGKNYGIAVKKKGYLFYSENYDIPASAAYKQVYKTIPLQTFAVGNKIALKNVFYDYGKATLRPESLTELNQIVKLMSVNTDVRIEIASHTDSQGSAERNMMLSKARSQSVADYLFAAGISKDQLVVRGYGETKPIASNDSEEGRQLNRRTEITILGQ